MKIISKIFNKIQGQCIKILEYINVRLYMKLYVKYLQKKGIHIPNYDGRSYIHPSVDFDGSGYNLISIGQGVTISKDVLILVHDYSIGRGIIAASKENNSKMRYKFMKEIKIADGVFIGARSTILPGSTIGRNSVIGTGSIVSGSIDDNSIAVGVPARKKKSLEEWGREHIEKGDYESYLSK